MHLKNEQRNRDDAAKKRANTSGVGKSNNYYEDIYNNTSLQQHSLTTPIHSNHTHRLHQLATPAHVRVVPLDIDGTELRILIKTVIILWSGVHGEG